MVNFNTEVAVQLGEFLRKKREERKVNLEKASEATFISPLYLDALEKGEWGRLPGKAYASGYLKIYSRFLGVDPQEVLALFNRAYGGGEEKISLVPEKISGKQKKNILRFLMVTFAILVVAFVFILISYRLPIFSELNREEKTVPIVEETIPPEEVLPTPQATPGFSVVVVLEPESLSWSEVRSGDRVVFSGILVPGKRYVFKSNGPIEISGKDGDRVKVNLNGKDLGYLASENGDFEQTFGP
ncbi:MAG: helix-turn-helix domain-containing protein [Candidatus Atribacteria bacterium]|nr:helix-turn-helix domain-containing protein [Candidatus Atribacteria bacterium]